MIKELYKKLEEESSLSIIITLLLSPSSSHCLTNLTLAELDFSFYLQIFLSLRRYHNQTPLLGTTNPSHYVATLLL